MLWWTVIARAGLVVDAYCVPLWVAVLDEHWVCLRWTPASQHRLFLPQLHRKQPALRLGSGLLLCWWVGPAQDLNEGAAIIPLSRAPNEK